MRIQTLLWRLGWARIVFKSQSARWRVEVLVWMMEAVLGLLWERGVGVGQCENVSDRGVWRGIMTDARVMPGNTACPEALLHWGLMTTAVGTFNPSSPTPFSPPPHRPGYSMLTACRRRLTTNAWSDHKWPLSSLPVSRFVIRRGKLPGWLISHISPFYFTGHYQSRPTLSIGVTLR